MINDPDGLKTERVNQQEIVRQILKDVLQKRLEQKTEQYQDQLDSTLWLIFLGLSEKRREAAVDRIAKWDGKGCLKSVINTDICCYDAEGLICARIIENNGPRPHL